jgi:Cof subfamily protein (haloacid dehalogenase superfamily)
MINEFKRRGGHFSLATGRIEKSVKRYCRELMIDAPVILYNGARIYDPKKDEVIREHCLNPSDVRRALDLSEDFPFDSIYYSGGEAYIRELTSHIRTFQDGDGYSCIPVESLDFLVDKPVTKILMIADDDSRFDAYRARFDGEGDLIQSEHNYLEILPSGVNKGVALEELAEYLGLSLDEIVCFGDNPNDLEMIRTAGLGVAMDNAHEELKANADLIAPPHGEGGVGSILSKIISGVIK